MNRDIRMETDNDKEEVCLSDSRSVRPDSCRVQPQINFGASTSKCTGNSLNTSLHLSVGNPYNEHNDYSSESDDSEELFDDKETHEKLNHPSAAVEPVRDLTSDIGLDEHNGESLREGVCVDSSKDIEIHFDESHPGYSDESNAQQNNNSNISRHTDSQRETFTGLDQNHKTFSVDATCLSNDGNVNDNFKGGSLDSSVRERRSETMHKTLEAYNKLILSLSALEKHLAGQLAKVQQKLNSVKSIKSILLCDKYLQTVDKTRNLGLQSCFPYFQHSPTKSVCPPNEDSSTKVIHSELVMSNCSVFSHWSPGDKMRLKKAVQQVIHVRKLRREVRTVKSVCCPSRSESEALGTTELEDHEWEDVAKELQEKHSAAECRGMWINHLKPSLNCKPFTQEKQKRLSELAEQYGKQDWDAIAAALGTGHSALQCYILYMNTCTAHGKHRWSREENSRLQSELLKNQIGKTVDWKAVIFHMQRPSKGIADHWKYVANPSIKKGKFTQIENRCLLKGIRMFGTNFSKISRYFLPSRTSKQLRSHYKTLVSPSLMGDWSKEEDMNLLRLVEKYSTTNWSQICKHFIDPVRTRGQVRSRYLVLKRWLSSSDPFQRPPTRLFMARMNKRKKLLKLAQNENSVFPSTSRRPNKHEEESKIDINIKKFLSVNFVEGRSERLLEKAFTLEQEEVEKRAYDVKQLLPLLNAKVNITDAILKTDVSISNHDKLVFYQLQKELSKEVIIDPLNSVSPHRTPVLDATPNVFKDTQMITFQEETASNYISTFPTPSDSCLKSSALPIDAWSPCKPGCICSEESVTDSIHGECSSSASCSRNQDLTTPHSPCEADATSTTEHSDFLVPSVAILDTLIDILLDKELDEQHIDTVQPVYDSEEEDCSESFKTANNLFMERLKTVFLCPLLLTTKNVELAETVCHDADTSSNSGNLNIIEEDRCTNNDVSSKVRKRGRPRKGKKRAVSEEEQLSQPKRKYVRTGKYSKCKNITPRVNLRTSSTKSDGTQESLQESN